MTQDSALEESTNDSSGNNSVEQRLTALEEQNKELKAALEHQQSGLPNMTRRQALGGLLGGGALLGAAGSASAQPPSGPGGPPFADEDHDHSGDYLGEGEPVARIDSGRVNATDELNNVEIVRPGDDIQAAIDSVYEPGDYFDQRAKAEGNWSGMVRFLPNHPDNQLIYEFPDPPYVVKPGVTLDMRGIVAELTADAKALFDLQYAAKVLGHGAYMNAEREDSFTGACWYVGSDESTRWEGSSMRNAVMVKGYPTLDVPGTDGGRARPILLETTKNGSIGGARFEVNCCNSNGIAKIKVDGGYANLNTILARGSVVGSNAIEYECNDGVLRGNYVWIDQLQPKNINRMLYCHGDAQGGIARNYTLGNFVDLNHLRGPIAEWDNGVGQQNPLFTNVRTTGTSAVDNSGTYGNYVGHLYKSGQQPFDLSKRRAFFDGERAEDDGTNTAHRGVECTWDGEEGAWVRPDGSTFKRGGGGSPPPELPQEFSLPNQSLTVDSNVSELSDTPGLKLNEDFRVRKDPTASGTVWVTWDQSYLYYAADIKDDQHTQPESGAGAIYEGDVFELAVAPPAADSFIQIDAALTPQGPEVYKSKWPRGGFIGQIDVPVEITRNEGTNHTVYEAALPWGELPVDHTDNVVKMALGYRDVDGDTNVGQFEWGGGIIAGKDPSKLNPVELVEE